MRAARLPRCRRASRCSRRPRASSIACSGSTAGGTALAIASEPGDYWQVRLSPDDRQAAVTMLEPLLRTLDVYVLRGGSGAPVPVTLGLAADTDPVWSPDGRTAALPLGAQRAGAAVHAGGRHARARRKRRCWLLPADAAYANVRAVGVVARRRHPVRRDRRITARHRRLPRTASAPREPWRLPWRRASTNPIGPSLSGRPVGGLYNRTSRDRRMSTCRAGRRDLETRVSQAGGSHPRWSGASLVLLARR